MRSKSVMMIVMAVLFGAMAIFAGQKWLDRQSSRLRAEQVVVKPAPTQTIVVAASSLRFGMEVTRQQLREISWPEGAMPKGAYRKVDEVVDGKTRRVALAAIEENEPIFAAKITGPGQRGSLAAVIQEGMKAVTVRVNDVLGVAGFVLPGERVDVILTRNDNKEGFADVLLQNVKVLAVDQSADERAEKPAVVKAVTLEVGTADAQKLTLAATAGSLSLALRSAGAALLESTRRVSVEDLARPEPARAEPAAFVATAEPPRTMTLVGVTRALKRQEYNVLIHAGPEAPQSGTASTVRGPRF